VQSWSGKARAPTGCRRLPPTQGRARRGWDSESCQIEILESIESLPGQANNPAHAPLIRDHVDSAGNAGAAEAFLPARDDFAIINTVGHTTAQRREHRAGRPHDTGAKLPAFVERGGMRREQHLVAKRPQRRIRGQRLLLESVKTGGANTPGRERAGERG